MISQRMRSVPPSRRIMRMSENAPSISSATAYRKQREPGAVAGSIFLDVNCDKNFTDPYSLLYGHHMEESKMFGDLDLYKDAEFFAENTTGELILPDRTYDLKTFACLLVPSSESAIFQPQRWDSDLQGLYTFAQENALNLNTETLAAMKAAGDDAQVLALSTCSTEFTDARTILLAWMIPSASDS